MCLVKVPASFLIQLPTAAHPGSQNMADYGLGILAPIWKVMIQFKVPGLSLAQTYRGEYLGIKQEVGRSLSLSDLQVKK